ncbi:Butirosin biosynthesis, BtrG-like protein [Mycena belliarum]|uniref:gamma-glutamylcyclotransferase n=1 Tax=Mycena belliarum TaxID=1033014 RepID=A0AAD6XQQ4_9AGAR|nr:Butirosin biosynthesis, BtrG-like protein [Mycena belliae]
METAKKLYFGYGSNLWRQQMDLRCPENKFLGVGRLADWRWMINTRGYANVAPSPGDEVYAFLYELSVSDEESLDRFEGVPVSYVKQIIPVEHLRREGKKTVQALVYVDVERLDVGPPKEEYVGRMNSAIADALSEGIPRAYIDKYLRPHIPAHGVSA